MFCFGWGFMNRFQGKAGKRLLLEALRQQRTLGCCEPAITALASAVSVRAIPKNARVIIQGNDDNRMAFVLSGRVNILIKGQKVAERVSGQHVGEMSVIDPSARRSATVIACEPTVVAWVEENDFTRIATAYPELWRALAVELADRLRQRGALIRDRNTISEIFIGSSSESRRVVNAVEKVLKPDPVVVKPWTKGVFGASQSTIESLEKLLPQTDFAILILTADDKLRTRRQEYRAPRDNVIFELGLFIGAIGRRRTFMLVEKEPLLRLPPDLHGVTYLPLEAKSRSSLQKSIAQAVSQVRERVSEIGPR
jgi:predicted nucleotide-binding protein